MWFREKLQVTLQGLQLTCGHRVERSIHHTQRYWIGATMHCPEFEVT